MSLIRLCLLVVLTLYGICCQCQQVQRNDLFNNSFRTVSKITDSGKYVISFYKNGCKGYLSQREFIPNPAIPPTEVKIIPVVLPEKKTAFLIIHGSVSYDYFYRSKIDTPINQQNFQQHTERVSLDLLFKEKYPLKVSFSSRQSNSPYFKNFIDPNIQFDKFKYNKNLKQGLVDKLNKQLPQSPDLKLAAASLKEELNRYNQLKARLESPATLQKIIEEREKAYSKELNEKQQAAISQQQPAQELSEGNDPDSSLNRLTEVYNKNKIKVDSAYNAVQTLRARLDSIKNNINDKKNLNKTAAELKEKTTAYEKMKSRLDSSDAAKGIHKLKHDKDEKTAALSEKKDSLLVTGSKIKDSLISKGKSVISNADSSLGFTRMYKKDKEKLDTLNKKIQTLQKRVDSLNTVAQKKILTAKQKIYSATNEKELKKIAKENGIDTDSTRGKFEKQLSFIRQLSIGRGMLDYTELTAQNILITGVNVEYNPSYYAAFAAGKIDYRFRDFFNKNSSKNKQYIVLGRIGIGNKEKRALIFTFYQGRKNQSEFIIADSIVNHVNLMGYSLEGIIKKDENTSLSAEFAKSTRPVAGNIQNSKQSGLLKFSDYTNMGINIKAQTIIAETNTRLSGFFRKTGENFQSFSLFSYNTDQTAWMVRADQSFFKRKLMLNAMLRQNDFTNPFSEKTFKTSTVFKSIIVNVRIPKYPSLSVGYYPGTQIYFIDKERIRENAYYILNGSLVYSYFFKGVGMNSSFVYNRYSNQATDSGFVLYKGINYFASQTIFLKKFQLQGGYSYTRQPELKYYTLESSCDYSLSQFLKLGAGIKYNKVKEGNDYWGQRALLSVALKQLGTFQFQYEKSFLPTISHTLYPVEIGRVTWYKYF